VTIEEALKSAQEEFRSQNVSSSSRLDAELLLGKVLGKNKTELIFLSKMQLSTKDAKYFSELVARRKSGEPVAYILGQRDFYKSTFEVGPGVLIPRPETEHIVEDVVEYAKTHTVTRILDLGTGSGCIGLSCLLELSSARLVGVEKSAMALGYARRNGIEMGLDSRVQWLEGDVENVVLQMEPGFFDVVVANPPYIGLEEEVQPGVFNFEPHEALFSPNRGFSHLESWAKVAIPRLRPGGLLVFEFGSGQGVEILYVFEKTQAFEEPRIRKDLAGLDRRLWATRK
jgi:release factor glutamine methyltransferase